MTNEDKLNYAIFLCGGSIAVFTPAWIVGVVVFSIAFANLGVRHDG